MKTTIKTSIFILNILFVLTFSGCVSSERLLEKGDYDAAFEKSLKKIQRNPDKTSEYSILKKSYTYAQRRDSDKIEEYRKSGQPNIWGNIFELYSRLNQRQNKIKSLPYQVRNSLSIPEQNYASNIEDARLKAAEYHYVLAQQLLEIKDKRKARDAYQELNNVDYYITNYKDVVSLKTKALNQGKMFVLIRVGNNSNNQVPNDFLNELERINTSRLNSTWVLYDIFNDANKCYDYLISINVQEIRISPELVKENNYSYDKEVEDGIQPKLDRNGIVLKDSVGNIIYEKRYKKIYCYVRDLEQHKDSYVNVSITYYDNIKHNIVKSTNVDGGFSFNHIATTANGDLSILPNDIRRRLGSMPAPFPNDFEMLMQSSVVLNDKINSYLQNNTRVIY